MKREHIAVGKYMQRHRRTSTNKELATLASGFLAGYRAACRRRTQKRKGNP